MGSGCNNGSRKVFGTTVVDGKVVYTGPAIPSLGICTGDTLSEVESVILEKIFEYSTGKGITIAELDLSQCDVTSEFVVCCAQNNSLVGILDVIVKSICRVQTNIESMSASIGESTGLMLDPKCLVISDNTKLQPILQAIIDSHCDLKAAFENVFVDLDNPSINPEFVEQINNSVVTKVMNQITSCNGGITKTGVGAATTMKFTAMVPVNGWVWYDGSLSNFDSTGLGLAEAGMCGWAIGNGQNGTRDARGYALAGATNVQGGSLDSAVDASVHFDSDYSTNVGDKKGEVKHILTQAELPTASISTPAHAHTVTFNVQRLLESSVGSTGNVYVLAADAGDPTIAAKVFNTSTAASIPNSIGQGFKHENRQPTLYGVWIKRIS